MVQVLLKCPPPPRPAVKGLVTALDRTSDDVINYEQRQPRQSSDQTQLMCCLPGEIEIYVVSDFLINRQTLAAT